MWRGGNPPWRTIAIGAALWAALTVPLAVQISSAVASGEGGAYPWVELFAGSLIIAVAVALSFRRPLVALCIPVAIGVLQAMVPVPAMTADVLTAFIVVAVLAYRAGRRLPRAKPVLVAVAITVVACLLVGVIAHVPLRGAFGVVSGIYEGLSVSLGLLLGLVFPWLAGRYRRQHAELVSGGWERAEMLEHHQQISADRARLQERARIAQDMHDTLGHELNLIALRAAALEMADDVGGDFRAAAGELRVSVAMSAERLREIIGVLRADGEAAPVAPPATNIAELVERAVAAGMTVVLEREGENVDSPVLVVRAAYRVVQEALTNATKYAPGAAVTVRVSRSSAETVVTVVNEPPTAAGAADNGGLGLIGLRERVRLLGGTLDAAPHDDGYEVAAHLPHAAEAGESGRTMAEATTDTGSTESAQRLYRTRRRVRHRLAAAIAVPAGVGTGIAVILLGLQLVTGLDNTLASGEYERLHIGQQRATVERVLPPFQVVDLPPTASTDPPPGSMCQFYWSSSQSADRLYFRLCFAEGRLVDKDALPQRSPGP